VACAFTLYGAILDRIADAGYEVAVQRRVRVPHRTRAAVALPGLGRALAARGIGSRGRPGNG
jgi:phytoene synthase